MPRYSNGRKKSLRLCPGCHEEKEFDVRSEFCSVECANNYRVPAQNVDPRPLVEGVKRALKADAQTKEALAVKFKKQPGEVQDAIDELGRQGYNIQSRGKHGWRILSQIQPGTKDEVVIHPKGDYDNKWYKFGVLGDNHFGSKHERVDVVKALYDRYEEEGITEVFHTGNWIEGEFRMNKHDIKVFGMDNQIQYFLENYPQKKGMTTYFVAGDDHEGWYQQREGIEIGRHLEQSAVGGGRNDLKYLGYVEADVLLKAQHGERIMRVCHPGGGSAYALSYSAQKIVESYQGGEKPSILLYGHYHKMDYNYYREVHCLGTACCVDQSIFMRKQKIQAHVGGSIIKFNQAPDGTINRFALEFMPFYNKGYYTSPRQFGDKPSVRLVR